MLTPPVIQRMLYAILTQKQREKFEEELELDFAYACRAGPASASTSTAARRARRCLPPDPVRDQAARGPRRPAGGGQLRDAAAWLRARHRAHRLRQVDDARRRSSTWRTGTASDHIMTVEDPIEFLHEHKTCLVNQREVGEDTRSFKNALKHVLRQDPDIILVGEMRDLETIEVALTAAETGHLVIATLHTQDAAQTIDRVIDVFPPHQQQQVRVQLAGALQGVVCQPLCARPTARAASSPPRCCRHARHPQPHPRGQDPPDLLRACRPAPSTACTTMDQHLAELVKQGQDHLRRGAREVPPRRGLQPALRPGLRGRRPMAPRRSTTRSATARAS